MSRDSVYTALILGNRSLKFASASQEFNREVSLLTAEAGILRVTVFGGPKSKLRSYASPFHSGQAWIYHEPVRDSRKLSDFDVKEWRPGLRELYERIMAAEAVAETVLASHGGGGHWEKALFLAETALNALTSADSVMCNRILLHFMWQWAEFLGLKPEFHSCSHCAKEIPSDKMLWYLPGEGGLVCNACRNMEKQNRILEVGPGCRHWLETVLPLSPSLLSRYTLDKKSFDEAKILAAAILAEMLGKKLNSWEW